MEGRASLDRVEAYLIGLLDAGKIDHRKVGPPAGRADSLMDYGREDEHDELTQLNREMGLESGLR